MGIQVLKYFGLGMLRDRHRFNDSASALTGYRCNPCMTGPWLSLSAILFTAASGVVDGQQPQARLEVALSL